AFGIHGSRRILARKRTLVDPNWFSRVRRRRNNQKNMNAPARHPLARHGGLAAPSRGCWTPRAALSLRPAALPPAPPCTWPMMRQTPRTITLRDGGNLGERKPRKHRSGRANEPRRSAPAATGIARAARGAAASRPAATAELRAYLRARELGPRGDVRKASA